MQSRQQFVLRAETVDLNISCKNTTGVLRDHLYSNEKKQTNMNKQNMQAGKRRENNARKG